MNNLKTAALMALAAYDDYPEVDGFSVLPFRKANVQGFVAENKYDTWIAFAGTNDVQDWIENLDTRLDDAVFGRAHSGFLRALDVVWPEVLMHTRTFSRVHLVGHSLGGALAALAGKRLIDEEARFNVRVYTFGQPRCGDVQWAQFVKMVLGDRYLRVCNEGDIIPFMPAWPRFAHAGESLFFDADGNRITQTAFRLFFSAIRAMLRRKTTDAHSMDRYLANVAGA